MVLLGLPIAALLLWGFGVPGHAKPGGIDSPAAVAARARIVAQQEARAQDAAYLAVLPKGKPSFSAFFNGQRLNKAVWATCYPGSDTPRGCTNYGNKREYEWYLPAQDQVSGGVLKLTAQRTATPGRTPGGAPKQYGCRSGMVTTYPSLHFTYGFLQIQAKIAHAAGLWSALWLAPVKDQWPPEIDIIESWDVHRETSVFFHPSPVNLRPLNGPVATNSTVGWVTYSVYWSPSKLEFFVGHSDVLIVTAHVPHQEMYFLANLAEYLQPADGNCTGELDIYSIKYWRP
jgi:beta-glucanase (GH16 family)